MASSKFAMKLRRKSEERGSKCEVCRKYQQRRTEYSFSAYWNPFSLNLQIHSKSLKLATYLLANKMHERQ